MAATSPALETQDEHPLIRVQKWDPLAYDLRFPWWYGVMAGWRGQDARKFQ